MKLSHKSTDAGQIVNNDPKITLLSDYIKSVVKQEQSSPFDQWIDELYVELNGEWWSRRQLWSESEVNAAKAGWVAAKNEK